MRTMLTLYLASMPTTLNTEPELVATSESEGEQDEESMDEADTEGGEPGKTHEGAKPQGGPQRRFVFTQAHLERVRR